MTRRWSPLPLTVLGLAVAGCTERAANTLPAPGDVRQPPAVIRPDQGGRPIDGPRGLGQRVEPATPPEVSWETPRDEKFAQFLRENSGGMIRKAAVGIEKGGTLRVEVSRLVSPDDTLPLIKSLLGGARKDFPDRPILMTVYDPDGAAILRARFRPGEGVHYALATETGPATERSPAPQAAEGASAPASTGDALLSRGGVTKRDQAFAAWAEKTGKPMLRYVEADLERNGRLWFGVTKSAKPEDVRPLTDALLHGARDEFPQAKLSATVFDPEGGRIGLATLDPAGRVRWEP